ncbi:MAG: putative Zn-ribbon and HTH transcriptional regulator [Akkermansiaceae bacterium]|jgi:predicted Zn-ribbon and HTH transcriptional regulator
MAHHIKCSSCTLDFISGQSHHEKKLFAICRGCGESYGFSHRESEWGLVAGELCTLMRYRPKKGKWVDTGQSFAAIAQDEIFEGKTYKGATVELSEAKCDSCGGNSLAYTLEVDSDCPKCKQGVIENHGLVIF